MKIHAPEIRILAHDELSVLDHVFPSEYNRTHADDLSDQARGELSFLVAWLDGEPAGHVLVKWTGARQPVPAAAFPHCPEIYRLTVRKRFRRRGIASALVRACVSEAKRLGHTFIGLGTDPSVADENNLYIKLGFIDSGIGLFDDVYEIAQEGGSRVVRVATKFVVKKLDR